MLNELINLTHSIEFEEYGALDLRGVSRVELNALRLSLNLNTGRETDADQIWEVDCIDVQEHQISLGHYERFSLYNDHVLLWPYNSPTAFLSFYGEAEDPLAVVRALMNSHFDLTENLVPFEQYMNGHPLEMIAGRYGLLAEGPMPLIEVYKTVLDSFGIGAQIAKYRHDFNIGNDEFSGAPKLEVLVLRNERSCYVVASTFNARRVA